MKVRSRLISPFYLGLTVLCLSSPCPAQTYPIVDTGQERCYDDRVEITYPESDKPFFGQDAQYRGNSPAYRDHGDGTISDLVTGLMWQKDPGAKRTFPEAISGASACRLGGYDDWRLPSIKELYSLICFSGEDVDPFAAETSELKPFINADYFQFTYGDPEKGERVIDSQAATSTKYVSSTMHGNETMFGVNFADGRIKGYPAGMRRRGLAKYYVYYVRGNPDYGKNDFHDNGDGTITDRATGLCWAKDDSGHLKAGANQDGKLNWQEALRWVEELEYAGHSDWRLPNAKELQSIVDYTRSPDTTNSAAINPIFQSTPIRDGLGEVNYGFYWTGTTHKRGNMGSAAAYVAFGRSQGWMPGPGGERRLLDVHGAGSQRSDPKAGDPSRFPQGRGPQGDVIGIYNLVRPVRGGRADLQLSGPELAAARQIAGPGREGLGQTERDEQQPGPRTGTPADERRPDPRAGTPAEFIKRWDRDGDGKVSRQEFGGPPPVFRRNDRNGDGYLSEDETPMGLQRGNSRGGMRGRQGGSQEQEGGPQEGPGAPERRPGAGGGGIVPESESAVTLDETAAAASGTKIQANAAWCELPPSFVFILADDMGWTGLSVASDDRMPESKSDFYQTPHIDSLAHAGIRFSNAYAPASMCTPTRASLLTGKSPAQLHMTTPGPPVSTGSRQLIPPKHIASLPGDETTIAEVLRRRGYGTAHFGKWHLAGGGPGEHGFDRHDGDTANEGPGVYGDPNPKDIFGITSRAIRFMEEQVAAGKPFYVQLSHYAVHGPTQTLRSSEEKFAGMSKGENHQDAAYAGMTHDLDTSVGLVLEKIERLGIAQNTYVVFMSDNGAAGRPGNMQNAPLAGGKGTFFEGGVRVPLIVRGPGVSGGNCCHENVIGYDLFPTFCEMAGEPCAPSLGIEGTSLMPLLIDGGDSPAFKRTREGLIFHCPHYGHGPRQTPQSAIVQGHYKLLLIHETGTNHLFKLSNDIGEQNDLSESMPEKVTDMEKALFAYLREVEAQMLLENPDYDPDASLSPGRALGGRAGANAARPGATQRRGNGRNSTIRPRTKQ